MTMRVALLSDIHANLIALEAVLDDIRATCQVASQRIDAYWFLGDVVGYGPQPRQCLQRLEDLLSETEPWLAGNHDLGLVHCLRNNMSCKSDDTPDDLRDLIGNMGSADALQIQAWELAGYEDQSWYQRMAAAPTWSAPWPGVVIAHGTVIEGPDSMVNVNGEASYLRDSIQANSAFRNIDRYLGADVARLLVVGHTHVPTLMQSADRNLNNSWNETRSPKNGDVTERSEVVIELAELDGQRIVLCPGSIGQPRDHDARASYVILTFDHAHLDISFRRVPYNIASVQDLMLDSGYPKFLADRLALGK
jgi:predicted phosphodiesterase